jgi:hypothetical protein
MAANGTAHEDRLTHPRPHGDERIFNAHANYARAGIYFVCGSVGANPRIKEALAK